ncbi:MAG: hypothetical protein AB7G75_00165 [Candidatus Binatia bacterium]
MVVQKSPDGTLEARRCLRLELVFRELGHDLLNATAVVHVEDSEEADAPARILMTQRFPGLTVWQQQATVTLVLSLPDLVDAAMPVLRIHIDTDNAGEIRPGHFLNPTTVAVPDPSVSTLRIELVRVG